MRGTLLPKCRLECASPGSRTENCYLHSILQYYVPQVRRWIRAVRLEGFPSKYLRPAAPPAPAKAFAGRDTTAAVAAVETTAQDDVLGASRHGTDRGKAGII
jgi:hypothetical protein